MYHDAQDRTRTSIQPALISRIMETRAKKKCVKASIVPNAMCKVISNHSPLSRDTTTHSLTMRFGVVDQLHVAHRILPGRVTQAHHSAD